MRIGFLTSGGDAPGMNAAINTLTRASIGRGHTPVGIARGYQGLLDGDARTFSLADVDGISRFGGTELGSARCKEFQTASGRARAAEQIEKLALDGLVVIGGNGSLTGAELLSHQSEATVVGIPASIDNDIGHCGLSVGVDTAVNTIVEACDRISDTARAHRRAFIVEVMGRHCGYLAMRAGIAAEADAILYAEKQIPEDALVEKLRAMLARRFDRESRKKKVLIIKAEGVAVSTEKLASRLQAHLDSDAPGADVRATVLGHVVRGGRPSALDRVIAQRLALGAILAVEDGADNQMLAWESPLGAGERTADRSVFRVPLPDVLAETARLLDGSSPVTAGRLRMLDRVEGLLAL